MNAPSDIESAVAWLREQAGQLNFGRAGIEVVAHDGRITRIVTTSEVSTSAGQPTRDNRNGLRG